MKCFDAPHILSFSEKAWILFSKIMLLPIAYPLIQLSKQILSGSSPGFIAVVAMFGPLLLNGILWGWAIWRFFLRKEGVIEWYLIPKAWID
jgi:hypothetical protein